MLLYPISYSIPIFLPCLRFCLPTCLLARLPRCLLWGYTLASIHALLCMIILVVHRRSRSLIDFFSQLKQTQKNVDGYNRMYVRTLHDLGHIDVCFVFMRVGVCILCGRKGPSG